MSDPFDNSENINRFAAVGKQALENAQANAQLNDDLKTVLEKSGDLERRLRMVEKQQMTHRNKHENRKYQSVKIHN